MSNPRHRKLAKYGAVVGIALALICNSVPPRYQAACNVAAQLAPMCAGGH